MGIFMAKRYTKDEINYLKSLPIVQYIRENRLVLTLEFRQQLYREWEKSPSIAVIRRLLKDNGIHTPIVPYYFISTINRQFNKYGFPTSKSNITKNVSTPSIGLQYNNTNNNNALLATGLFHKQTKGISFTNEFVEEIRKTYPEVSIEAKLIEKGIDPNLVGYHRIYNLFLKLENIGYSYKKRKPITFVFSKEIQDKYRSHPYISLITDKQIRMRPEFYRDARFFTCLPIDEILEIFNFDPEDFDYFRKASINYKIKYYEVNSQEKIHDEIIEKRILDKTRELLVKRIINLQNFIKTAPKQQKKEAVELIAKSSLKQKVKFASLICICKSSYYSILKDDNYSLAEQKQREKDKEDWKSIKQVLDTAPYPMGKRMVYMKMDAICGFHFSIKKIARLMRANNASCKVREPSENRKAARDLLKKNCKKNLLQRRFRIGKPLSSILTDVTYLKYGDEETAYCSLTKDSVTGKILSCVVSENNDYKLIDDTLEPLINYNFAEDTIFHSDQGILYLQDYIQVQIENLGFRQSMSKRGNSQDNASCETLFGHAKDEVNYKDCSTVEEVQAKIYEYVRYYNEERPQWTRNRMTPNDYEKYLLSLDDVQYNKYLEKEEEKYRKMKERAKELAIKHNKTLGV